MTTPGKYRHLSRSSTPDGHFVVLAIDHRANLLDALQQHAPITDAEFTAFKQTILQAAAGIASAVLTDPAYGIGAGIAARRLPGGLLAPVEVTNYALDPSQRPIEFIPHWSVQKIKQVGGDGVKLLLPYHPDAANASERRTLVQRLIEECAAYDIPLFLEPIPYALNPAVPLTAAEQRQITVNLTRVFSDMGVDILKLHFPAHCDWYADVTAASSVPWTLLSAGVNYPTFLEQAHSACAAGASGVIVGRALWNEAVALQGAERTRFIETTLIERLRELAAICAAQAAPWFDRISPPDASPTWYESYLE